MKKEILLVLATSLVLAASNGLAEEQKGAESIILGGGNNGSVTFPHGKHQGMFVDCLPCHGMFAKEPHSVDKMKSEGKLAIKQVMNMCKGCHADLKAKGEKAGPTSCSGCHKK